MRGPALRRLVLMGTAGLLVTGPATVRATDVRGFLGAGYSRGDSWTPAHLGNTWWQWRAGILASGSPLSPGLLRFDLMADYQSVNSRYEEANGHGNALTYSLDLNLLSRTVVPVHLSASRAVTEFSSDATTSRTGSTLANNLSGTVAILVPQRPALRLRGRRLSRTTTASDAAAVHDRTIEFGGSLSQSLPTHAYALDYTLGWNEGDYDELNYRSHFLTMHVNSNPTETVMFRVYERYFLRRPDVSSPLSPRFDDNALNMGAVVQASSRSTTTFDYSYRNLTVTAPLTSDRSSLGHGFTIQEIYRATADLNLVGNTGVQFQDDGLAGLHRRSVSERAGLGFNLSSKVRAIALTSQMFGFGGAVHPETGSAHATFGGNGSLAASGSTATASWRGQYGVSYGRDEVDRGSETFQQQLLASGTATVGRAPTLAHAINLGALLAASGGRRYDPLLGTSVQRSISATLSARRHIHSASLSAGQTDGLSASLENPVSDGLFLPAHYNSTTRYATLGAGQVVLAPFGELVFQELLRTLQMQAPGRPDAREHGLSATVSYGIGAVRILIDERLSVSEFAGSRRTVNVVMAWLTRSFTGSF